MQDQTHSSMPHSSMRICSIQVGVARKVMAEGRSILTAIHKTPVDGPVALGTLGVAGDEQVDLSVHGGLEKAVYAYPAEHYAYWAELRQRASLATIDSSLPHGSMGENLTLSGLLESQVWVGDRLEFAHCTLRVTQPREPCYKFNVAMGFNAAVRHMAQSGYCGFYLAVERPGTLQAGEQFVLCPGSRAVSVQERFSAKMFKHLR